MELNEMEKKMLFQAEGDCQAKVLNELYMTVRYTWMGARKPTPTCLQKSLRRFQKNMSTTLPFTVPSFPVIPWRARNRSRQSTPPPRFRRAIFLCPKRRKSLPCWGNWRRRSWTQKNPGSRSDREKNISQKKGAAYE